MDHGRGDMSERYLPMDPEVRDELREAMNIQFRYKLYKSPEFPFLPSMGINHIIQGFEDKEQKHFVGVLHLWYDNESGELSYHTKDKQFVAGHWKHESYDQLIDAYHLARYIQYSKPFDENKIVKVIMEYAEEMATKKIEKIVNKHLEKESDDELLN